MADQDRRTAGKCQTDNESQSKGDISEGNRECRRIYEKALAHSTAGYQHGKYNYRHYFPQRRRGKDCVHGEKEGFVRGSGCDHGRRKGDKTISIHQNSPQAPDPDRRYSDYGAHYQQVL